MTAAAGFALSSASANSRGRRNFRSRSMEASDNEKWQGIIGIRIRGRRQDPMRSGRHWTGRISMVVTEVWIGVSLGGERTSHGARMGGGDVPESCPVEAKSIYLPPNWRGTMGPAPEPPNAWRCAAAVAMLVPDVSALISVTVTQGPATGTPRIEIRYVEITFPTPKLVLGRDVTVSFQITDFALVPPVRGEPAPNEGHIEAYLDGVHYSSVTAFRPIPFSDLPDGDHTVTLRLVDNAGTPLTPDASDSVTFRIQFAPIVDINPYLSVIQIILAAAILIVLFYRDWGRSILDRLVARIRGRNA